MKKLLIPAAAAAVAVMTVLALTGKPAETTFADVTLDAEEEAFVTLLNNYRTQNGLPPLLIDWDIQEAADWHSASMGQYDYFSHIDHLGQTPWTRMCNFGYCFNTYKGENIAAGYITGASVFQGWKDSSGHNANMLGANYRVMGIARVYTAGSSYGWYWTNDFGGYVQSSTPPPAPTTTPTPTASPTPTPACPGDTDCDGWTDARETFLGTDRFRRCSRTTAANDESPDSLPADTNDDRRISATDLRPFVGRLGASSGQPLYSARLDLDGDGRLTVLDIVLIGDNLNTTCNP